MAPVEMSMLEYHEGAAAQARPQHGYMARRAEAGGGLPRGGLLALRPWSQGSLAQWHNRARKEGEEGRRIWDSGGWPNFSVLYLTEGYIGHRKQN